MTEAWTRMKDEILLGRDPYEGFNAGRHRPDFQGWNSHHTYLSDAILHDKASIVVEIGVWKGGSSIFMSENMQNLGTDGVIISVDTFLGSWEHYEQTDWFPSLMVQNGYPGLFYTFLTNVVERGQQNRILPLPLDSANAAHLLLRKGIKADLIHIDAGHDTEAVLTDLRLWWPILAPGGTMIADDYDPAGEVWPTVKHAVDTFLKDNPHQGFEALPYKARWRKPRAA